jgi:hypothetical protein
LAKAGIDWKSVAKMATPVGVLVGSSIRRYYADAHATEPTPTEPTSTPTGVAIFATDFQSIPAFAKRDHGNVVRWTHYDRGSHFSPHDAPDLLLEDIRAFYRDLR